MRIYPRAHTWCLLFGYIDRFSKHTREIYICSFSRKSGSATRFRLLYMCIVNGYLPFHILRDPGKFDEICLSEISMKIHFNFVMIIPSTLFQHFIIVLGLIYCRWPLILLDWIRFLFWWFCSLSNYSPSSMSNLFYLHRLI